VLPNKITCSSMISILLCDNISSDEESLRDNEGKKCHFNLFSLKNLIAYQLQKRKKREKFFFD
jgi:hypothetical protein